MVNKCVVHRLVCITSRERPLLLGESSKIGGNTKLESILGCPQIPRSKFSFTGWLGATKNLHECSSYLTASSWLSPIIATSPLDVRLNLSSSSSCSFFFRVFMLVGETNMPLTDLNPKTNDPDVHRPLRAHLATLTSGLPPTKARDRSPRQNCSDASSIPPSPAA